VRTTTLARGGPVVSRAGLGLMGMSSVYGPADDTESIATIRAALDAGVTLLDTGDSDIVPLIGTKRRDRLAEALAALDLELAPDDLAAIEAAVPAGAVAGERYDERQMAVLDSERS
jgi:aryl-alcohol dehydrogenase-like predicted oxidoreductase